MFGDTRVFFGFVFLPLHQELAIPAPVTHLKKAADRVSHTPINESGRWRGLGWRMKVGGDVWLDPGDMKNWKTGWMRRRGGGRFRWTAVGVSIREMRYGPIKRGANLEQVVRRGMSRADNQTLWPTE